VPVRVSFDDAFVHAVQRLEIVRVERCGHDHDEIDIADTGGVVAGDQGAVEIDADKSPAEFEAQAVRQQRENGANVVVCGEG